MKNAFLVIIILIFASCTQEKKELSGDEIVNNAIENAGGEKYKNAEIDFVFRNRKYKSKRAGGKFKFERIVKDSTGNEIHDILDNDKLQRFINDSAVTVQDSLVLPISNSINSVHYFVQLPFGLNASAANKELMGKDSIAGREYYEVMVTFSENGGGTDHEDEYMYWIDTKNFEVDFLAYNFEVNDGGVRFRKAFNHRIIEGVRFVDYENYKYEDHTVALTKLDSLYEQRELELLSLIETKDVEVKLNPEK